MKAPCAPSSAKRLPNPLHVYAPTLPFSQLTPEDIRPFGSPWIRLLHLGSILGAFIGIVLYAAHFLLLTLLFTSYATPFYRQSLDESTASIVRRHSASPDRYFLLASVILSCCMMGYSYGLYGRYLLEEDDILPIYLHRPARYVAGLIHYPFYILLHRLSAVPERGIALLDYLHHTLQEWPSFLAALPRHYVYVSLLLRLCLMPPSLMTMTNTSAITARPNPITPLLEAIYLLPLTHRLILIAGVVSLAQAVLTFLILIISSLLLLPARCRLPDGASIDDTVRAEAQERLNTLLRRMLLRRPQQATAHNISIIPPLGPNPRRAQQTMSIVSSRFGGHRQSQSSYSSQGPPPMVISSPVPLTGNPSKTLPASVRGPAYGTHSAPGRRHPHRSKSGRRNGRSSRAGYRTDLDSGSDGSDSDGPYPRYRPGGRFAHSSRPAEPSSSRHPQQDTALFDARGTWLGRRHSSSSEGIAVLEEVRRVQLHRDHPRDHHRPPLSPITGSVPGTRDGSRQDDLPQARLKTPTPSPPTPNLSPRGVLLTEVAQPHIAHFGTPRATPLTQTGESYLFISGTTPPSPPHDPYLSGKHRSSLRAPHGRSPSREERRERSTGNGEGSSSDGGKCTERAWSARHPVPLSRTKDTLRPDDAAGSSTPRRSDEVIGVSRASTPGNGSEKSIYGYDLYRNYYARGQDAEWDASLVPAATLETPPRATSTEDMARRAEERARAADLRDLERGRQERGSDSSRSGADEGEGWYGDWNRRWTKRA